MKIRGIEIVGSRWPWQGYGWFPHCSKKGKAVAPLNPNGARFGGGWKYKLGVSVGSESVLIDLLFGSIHIRKPWPECPSKK